LKQLTRPMLFCDGADLPGSLCSHGSHSQLSGSTGPTHGAQHLDGSIMDCPSFAGYDLHYFG
jgi:hypothetical protein